MSVDTVAAEEARVRVVRVLDGTAHVAIPGTNYQLHLNVDDGGAWTTGPVSCVVHAAALKVHPTRGGGQFMEPVIGSPRIICGLLRSIDAKNHRLLVDAVIPMWIAVDETTDLEALHIGGLVTSYVASGATMSVASTRD